MTGQLIGVLLAVFGIGAAIGFFVGTAGPCPDCDPDDETPDAKTMHEAYVHDKSVQRG